MSESQSFFRQEAIEYQAGERRPGDLICITPQWTAWLYTMMLAAVVAGVALTFAVHTDEVVPARSMVDAKNRTFAALVPSIGPADVPIPQRVRLEVVDARGEALTGLATRVEVADGASAPLWGFDSFRKPSLLVTGELVSSLSEVPSSPRMQSRAGVIISQRLVQVLVRDLMQLVTPGGQR